LRTPEPGHLGRPAPAAVGAVEAGREICAGVHAGQDAFAPAFMPARGTGPEPGRTGPAKDLADLVGQPIARRAAEISAAGGHHGHQG
jgi:magnesium chelatase family protein